MLFYTPVQWNLEGPRDWETMFTITLGLFPIYSLLLGLRISFVLKAVTSGLSLRFQVAG